MEMCIRDRNNPNMFADPLGLLEQTKDYYAPDYGEQALERARYLFELYIAYISTTDPVTIVENGDNVTIIAYAFISGGESHFSDEDDTTYREYAIQGIIETWSGDFDGKKVNVVIIDLNDSKQHVTKDGQKSVSITIHETTGVSQVNYWYDLSRPGIMDLYIGDNYYDPNDPDPYNRSGAAFNYSLEQFKRTAGHEFGHILGIADGKDYGYAQLTSKGDIISLMSSQWDTKATRLDLELALKAHRQNAWQKWETNTDLINKYGIKRQK